VRKISEDSGMMWNILSIWLAVVLFFKIFIIPQFIEDDSDENMEAYADEMMLYSKVCLAGIVLSNIISMIVS
jgi:hypothetical protein